MKAVLTVSIVLLLAGCVPNSVPGRPDTPIGPPSVRPQESADFGATTVDPDGHAVQFRFAWQLGDTSDWSAITPSGEVGYVSHAFSAPGVFEVTCQARDIKEGLSEWSDALTVLVGNPPRQPTRPDGVSGGWLDSSYTYRTVATDLDLDRIKYIFDWGDGSTDITGFAESGQYVEMSHSWSTADSFDVKVRAMDAAGLESEWSDVRRVGIRDPEGPGVLLWSFELGPDAGVAGAPAIDQQGRIMFGTLDGVLHCLTSYGQEVWTFQAGGAIIGSPAVGADRSVVFGCDDGKAYCVDSDGNLFWDYELGGAVLSSPALGSANQVYIGADGGRLYCFEWTGSPRWVYETGGDIVSSPAVAEDGTVYFGSFDSAVYAVSENGDLRWRYPTGGPVEASPAIGADGTVYAASWDGYLYALRPDGTLRWREPAVDNTAQSPVVGSDNLVYVGSDADGRLLAFYAAGGPAWTLQLPAGVESAPLLTDEGIAIVGAGYRLYGVSTFGQGSLAWDYRLAGNPGLSAAVGDDGTVYVGDDAGWFYGIRGQGELDKGPWPKFRHDARNTGRFGASW